MNYAAIKPVDIANGTGVRVTLFVSGCTHYCKGCFNAEAWDFNYGEPYTDATTERLLSLLKPSYIKGLTLLGGEPFEPQNQSTVLELVRKVRAAYPEKDIWCFTGYLLDSDLLAGRVGDPAIVKELLENIDVLVDGEFVEELKDPCLRFRGSSNQRIIDLKKTLETDQIVLWEGMNQSCRL